MFKRRIETCYCFVCTPAGALYPDGTGPMLKEDDAVPPGKVFSYEWILTKTHSPTSDDSNCVTRLYHSHLNTVKDINSGLVGPLIICKKGTFSTLSYTNAFLDFYFFFVNLILKINIVD